MHLKFPRYEGVPPPQDPPRVGFGGPKIFSLNSLGYVDPVKIFTPFSYLQLFSGNTSTEGGLGHPVEGEGKKSTESTHLAFKDKKN